MIEENKQSMKELYMKEKIRINVADKLANKVKVSKNIYKYLYIVLVLIALFVFLNGAMGLWWFWVIFLLGFMAKKIF